MTAVMGVWARRTLVTVWGTPSSRTRKLAGLRPGTNWWVLSRMTLASMLTMGTSTRSEKVSLLGFLTLGSGGGGGGGGSSASVFFLRMMVPLSVWGPASSGTGWVGLVCWDGVWGVGVVWALAAGIAGMRAYAAAKVHTERRRVRAGSCRCVVII